MVAGDWMGVVRSWGELGWLVPLAQVVLIDVTLAGDNAVVVGLAVARLHERDRLRAIAVGVGAAAIIRMALSVVAVRLLTIIGLTLAGGLLLLWVCWKMFRELRHGGAQDAGQGGAKSLRAAIIQIAVADLSMSLDNVLAVAGAARAHIWVMVAGLGLSVVLMGVAANFWQACCSVTAGSPGWDWRSWLMWLCGWFGMGGSRWKRIFRQKGKEGLLF